MNKTIIQHDKFFLKGKTKETEEGFLICDAVVTRAGVFPYLKSDGNIDRRYCPPEVVLDENTFDSLRLKPVIDGHPYTEPGQVITPNNAKNLKVGSVGEKITVSGGDVMARFVVTDKGIIEQIKSGKKRELSCGYHTTIDFTPGKTPDGQHYDSMQTSRNYNHLSIEKIGRVGNAKIVLDSGEEITGVDIDPDFYNYKKVSKGEKMENLKTISLDGVSYQVETGVPEKIQELKKSSSDLQVNLDSLSAENETLKADLDGAKKEIEKQKALQLDENEIDRLASEKAEVLMIAKTQLDASEVEGKSIKDLKIAVCGSVYESVNLDGKSDEYIQATYDRSLEKIVELDGADEKKSEKQKSKTPPNSNEKKVTQLDSSDSRMKMVERLQNAHKKEVK